MPGKDSNRKCQLHFLLESFELNNIRKNAVNIWRIRRKTLILRHEKDART